MILGLMTASVAVYALIPLLIVGSRVSMRFTLLHAYIAAVLVLGGFLGSVYAFPLADNVTVLAGQLSYGALVFTTLITVVASREVQSVRTILTLVITVNLVVFGLFRISGYALRHNAITNISGIDPDFFDQSVRIVLTGGSLIVGELLLLLLLLEQAKRYVGPRGMFGIYPLCYVGILALDGVLFPLAVNGPTDGVGSLIASGVQVKLVIAALFAPWLLLFLWMCRSALTRFGETPIHLGHLLSGNGEAALSRIDRQEQDLDEERQRLRSVADRPDRAAATVTEILDAAVNTVVIALDLDCRITHFNRGAERVLGWTSDQVRGRTPDFLHIQDYWADRGSELSVPPDLHDVIDAHAELSAPRPLAFLTRSGERVELSFSTTKIEDPAGRLLGYVGVGEDVTVQQRALEASLMARRREQESLIQLQQVNHLKADLISTVSHELRTPLSSIMGYAELLTLGDFDPLTSDQANAVDRLLRNAHRLEAIITSLLTLGSAEGAEGDGVHCVFDLGVSLAAVRDLAEDQVATSDGKLLLSFEMPASVALVRGNDEMLQRAIANLINNAIKFTPEGSVNVQLLTDPDGTTLTVSDTGIGISESDQRELFTTFFRSQDVAQRAIPGTGLGLSIVSTILDRHHATIDVKSTLGAGTTVTVRFPPAEASDQT